MDERIDGWSDDRQIDGWKDGQKKGRSLKRGNETGKKEGKVL